MLDNEFDFREEKHTYKTGTISSSCPYFTLFLIIIKRKILVFNNSKCYIIIYITLRRPIEDFDLRG